MGICYMKEYISINLPGDIRVIEKMSLYDKKDNEIHFNVVERSLHVYTLKIKKINSLHIFNHCNELTVDIGNWIVKKFPDLDSIYIFGEKTTRCPFEFSKLEKLRTLVIFSNNIFDGFPFKKFPGVMFYIGNKVKKLKNFT